MLVDSVGRGVGGAAPVQATYSGYNAHQLRIGKVTLTVNHPYAASADGTATTHGDYQDDVITKEASGVLGFTIVHAWGDANGLAANWDSRYDTQLPPQIAAPGCEMCGQPRTTDAGDGKRETFAAAWIVQSSKAARLHAQIGGSIYQLHHSVGVVAADVTLGIYGLYTLETFLGVRVRSDDAALLLERARQVRSDGH